MDEGSSLRLIISFVTGFSVSSVDKGFVLVITSSISRLGSYSDSSSLVCIVLFDPVYRAADYSILDLKEKGRVLHCAFFIEVVVFILFFIDGLVQNVGGNLGVI